MHRHHHRRGFRPPFGRRWYSSENVLERLESYQRDGPAGYTAAVYAAT